MWGRTSTSLLLLALATGLCQAQSRAVIGPPVVATSAHVGSAGAEVVVLDPPIAPTSTSLRRIDGAVVDTGKRQAVAVLGPPVVLTSSKVGSGVSPTGLYEAAAALGPPVVELPGALSCNSERFWVDAEVLLWWMQPANLPPLVTASPPGTAAADVLGAPGTTVLFGGSGVNGNLTAGARLTAGYWFLDRACGIETYYFQLGSETEHFGAGSPGNVGRPFFNAATGLPDAELVSFPGVVDGNVQVSASSGSLLGAGALVRTNLYDRCCYRLDALAGYRFLRMNDRLGIAENLTSTDPAQVDVPLGTNILVADNFDASNQFHGVDFGFMGETRRNAWSLSTTACVAVGTTWERVDINGSTTVIAPGFSPISNAGGLLALASNSGIHTRSIFAVVPTRCQLAYQVSRRMRLHAGYNFLYWSNVVRAGNQIDLVVNPALLPPPVPGAMPLRPALTFEGSSFWAQGIDLGMEFSY